MSLTPLSEKRCDTRIPETIRRGADCIRRGIAVLLGSFVSACLAASTLNVSEYTEIAGDLPGVVFAGKYPYVVTDDLFIPPGKSVNIEAGAVFLFKNFTGIQVLGKLVVKGEPGKPVVFTSVNDKAYNLHESPPAAPYDWNGINIHEDGIGTRISHAIIGYSVDGISSMTPFVKIDTCKFFQNGRASFSVEGEKREVGAEPYSYSVDLRKDAYKPKPLAIMRDPLAPKRNILRYSGVAVAAGGCALSVAGLMRLSESSQTLEHLSRIDDANLRENSSDQWVEARDEENSDIATTIAGLALLLVGGTGITLSFTF